MKIALGIVENSRWGHMIVVMKELLKLLFHINIHFILILASNALPFNVATNLIIKERV